MEGLVGGQMWKRSVAVGGTEEHNFKSPDLGGWGVGSGGSGFHEIHSGRRLRAFCLFGFSLVLGEEHPGMLCGFICWVSRNAGGGLNRRIVIKGGVLCSLLRSMWGHFIWRSSWAVSTMSSLWGLVMKWTRLSESTIAEVSRRVPCQPQSSLTPLGRLKLRWLCYSCFTTFCYKVSQTYIKIWETVLTKPVVHLPPPQTLPILTFWPICFQLVLRTKTLQTELKLSGHPFLDSIFFLSRGNRILKLVQDFFSSIFLHFYYKWMYPQTYSSALHVFTLYINGFALIGTIFWVDVFYLPLCFSDSAWLIHVTVSFSVPDAYHSPEWIYHISFFHSLTDGHLDGFRLWVMVSVAAMQVIIPASVWIYASF